MSAVADAAVIAGQIADGAPRKLVGVLPQSKVPVRAGAMLTADGQAVGTICSGVHSKNNAQVQLLRQAAGTICGGVYSKNNAQVQLLRQAAGTICGGVHSKNNAQVQLLRQAAVRR